MVTGAKQNTARPALLNTPDTDALMVALIMAPATYSRNKFFRLFEDQRLWHARRRAQMVRSLIKELTEPWELTTGQAPRPPAIVEHEELIDGELHLQFYVPDLGYRRSARLTRIEAAALRYCLDRAGKLKVTEAERATVELCLSKLAPQIGTTTLNDSELSAEPNPSVC